MECELRVCSLYEVAGNERTGSERLVGLLL